MPQRDPTPDTDATSLLTVTVFTILQENITKEGNHLR